MGRKLDLSGLSDHEAEHVLQVVQRDMKLRKKEEERLSELRQELDEEGSRCLLLSRQRCFNQRCCIRCCSPFTFLLNPKRQCRDCRYNVCKACRAYSKRERGWLCSACQKSRLLKTQSLEWFYNNVRKRFRRFGSAKVLKTLYRKHLVEHSALSELTEGSPYEESVCNEGSICGSDSAFYRQAEEHSMAETLSVALRVAEEAIDEAISKAEVDASTQQEKKNEALYLRQHRGELVEELAKTIVEKIINRRKTSVDIRAEQDQELPSELRSDRHHQRVCDEGSLQQNLWRSQSAFSLLDDEPSSLIRDQPFIKEGLLSALSTWKSVDWLDQAGGSSVLKSSDGNWIALQSTKVSPPSLLTGKKSPTSGALSAHEGPGSDGDPRGEADASWSDAQQEVRPALPDPSSSDWTEIGDSEGNWKWREASPARSTKEVEVTPSSPSIVDLILDVEEEEREVAAEQEEEEEEEEKKSATSSLLDNRKANIPVQFGSDTLTLDPLTSVAADADPSDLCLDSVGHRANQRNEELTVALQQLAGHVSESSEEEEDDEEEVVEEEELEEVVEEDLGGDWGDVRMGGESQESQDRAEEDERSWGMETDERRAVEEEEDEEEVKDRLCRLVAQARLTYFSSTDDELDEAGLSEGECEEGRDEEWRDDKMAALSYRICQLEKEVRASQFSSTEDELDRVGVEEEGDGGEGEEEEEEEELAVRVCKLAHQVSATQFSSTEEELDGGGGGEEGEEAEEESPWTFPKENAARAAHLSSLVGTSCFSSTEEQQDEEKEGGEARVRPGTWARRESLGDLDEKMFDLKDESEKETWGNSLDSQRTEGGEGRSESGEPGDEKRMETEPVVVKETEESPETVEGGGEMREEESDGEDEEFDKIINSMLTMTLEDMQGGGVNGDTPENGKTPDEKMKGGRESPFEGLRAESGVAERSEITDGGEENGSEREEAMPSGREDAAPVRVNEDNEGGTEGWLEENEGTDKGAKESREEEEAVVEDDAFVPEGPLTWQERDSAASLRSVTTEVLKLLNAAEELLHGADGEDPGISRPSLPAHTDPKKLDQQFSRLEENVYVAAGAVYGLEVELSDLEECARAVGSATSDMELSFLEEQVASAAARVHQSDLQVSNISARIAALRNAGLNVDTHVARTRTSPVTPVTLNSSRQQRRRLPAPPARELKES